MTDVNATVGNIDILINEYYDELPFLSDLFTIENKRSIHHTKNESNETDLSEVSVIIDYIKPLRHKSDGYLSLAKELSKI